MHIVCINLKFEVWFEIQTEKPLSREFVCADKWVMNGEVDQVSFLSGSLLIGNSRIYK